MNEQLKQRLVGAMVLIALAVIFLPTLFQREERVVIDTTTQIPPAPAVEPVIIKAPVKPEGIEAPSPELLFQPQEGETLATVPDPEPSKPPSPRLTETGVPEGWVVQVGSFKSPESAKNLTETLKKADMKAYTRKVTTGRGEFVRVFVGPFISQQRATEIKARIDKDYRVVSQVLRFNPVSGQ